MSASTSEQRHPQERGEHSRARILAAIRARHQSGMGWPTVEEIVADTGLGRGTVRHHVRWLATSNPPQVRVIPSRSEIVLLNKAPS